ncbi:mechanosensitive ion channel [Vibrio alginolyticus]|nr:mechanosensitive ion channel [Vibrio alginolyticus]
MNQLSAFYTTHPDLIVRILQNPLITAFVFIIAAMLAKLIKRGVFKATVKLSGGDEIVARLLSLVASYAVYLVGLVIILDLFGVNTASLVALVGAAGLAIGLALKDTLSNIAAGIMILFLKLIRPDMG